jgi:PAS domain S-box-containing protein
MKLIKAFIIPLVLIVVCGFLLRSAYVEVKNRSIDQLNNQQLVMAETAARGIESFFEHYAELLTQLSKMNQIASVDEQGRQLMQILYLTHASEIKGVTRVDASGRIIYTYPEIHGAIGTDLSSQEHIQKIMQTHKPVVSDVFDSVQGFVTIAFHVPVFEDGVFQGSLAVLIPFDQLSRKYLAPIKIGKDGYAWIISRKGVELYCPVPGHTGKSVFENCKDFPMILSMAREMVKGDRGTTTYFFDRVRGETVESQKKQATYVPVHLADTFWSIVVATPEDEALQIIQGFKDRWFLIIGLLMLITIVWTSYALRAFKILKEAEKRKQAEEALRESEEHFKAMFEMASIGMAQADPKTGQWLRVNQKMCEITGYPPGEILAMRIPEITHPDDRERDWEAFENVVSSKSKDYRLETRYIRKDGTPVWVNVNMTVIRDNDGQPVHTMATIEDITERKRAEEAIARERTFSEDIINSLPGIFYMYDDKGKLVRWNKKHEEATGYSSEEMLGMYVLDWFSEEHKQHILSRVQSVFAEGESLAEAPLLIKNGSQIPYFFTGRMATLDGKQYLLGVGVDITERKRSEAERTLLATAVEQAEVNVLVTDHRRTILYINPAFERSSGYRLEDLQGRKLRDLRSAQHDDEFYRNMKEILDRGEVWMGAIINKGKDGGDFEIEGTISPIRDASGAITHFVAAGRNMSRFRKLERELHQAQKMESVGRLAGGVAHDFNNMLGVILGHAELALLQVDSAQPAYVNLHEIQKAAHRSAKLVRQLLAFARKQTISPKVLDINETVESMLSMVRRLIGEDIELLWKPGIDVWSVKVDPTQIDQILANLCVNARDAIAGVGKVVIETGNVSFDETSYREHAEVPPGDFVLLAVNDTGCGMEKQVLDKLFEPFFTTKEVGKGTGLGLATVYGIVKQNNGFIEVQSEPGRGTTFRIYLPRTDTPAREEQPSQHQKKNLTGTETVLLVEDEVSLLELGKITLEHHGYQVLATRHPAEALNLVKNYPGRIDLLITDVIMPAMNGKELAERLSAVKLGIRSIFMSGYTSDVIAQHGVLDEGVHFLQKPFSVKSMVEKVREVLDT